MTFLLLFFQEFKDLSDSPIENIQAGPKNDDLLNWIGVIQGPADSPYKGGKFQLVLTFPVDYPFKPPVVKFNTKIYHPNFDEDGKICMEMLKTEHWKPAFKVSDVLIQILSLLAAPNPDDPLSPDVAEVYKNDYKKFEKTAKEWTKKHAS